MKKEDWPRCHECEFFDEEKFYCKQFLRSVTLGCPNGETKKPRNNFERIKAMSMEEMAEFIAKFSGCSHCPGFNVPCDNGCKEYWLDWLEEEVDG